MFSVETSNSPTLSAHSDVSDIDRICVGIIFTIELVFIVEGQRRLERPVREF